MKSRYFIYFYRNKKYNKKDLVKKNHPEHVEVINNLRKYFQVQMQHFNRQNRILRFIYSPQV